MPPVRPLFILACAALAPFMAVSGQATSDTIKFAHADTLRGSNGAARAWWDATFYDLHVAVQPADSSIRGWNVIHYRVLQARRGMQAAMQIDLQPPLLVDSIVQDGRALVSRRDGNAVFVTLRVRQPEGSEKSVAVYYHGHPRAAKNPPWDGGLIWRRDSLGNRWVATANQGLGASVWWPNKDYQADEPDSQRIAITVPDSMVDVSNGRLRGVTHHEREGTATYEWFVTQPINNYDVEINAGRYAHFGDVYWGERGPLTMDFWPLAYHVDTARVQFAQAVPMMKCFEWWFGPYPWYEDGYKLVEAPHLGMEHQSGTAYGNGFKNGYRGRDLSQTGWGTKWDFIIVHESAHEWWGNSITSKDLADEWVHESFANYSEALYTECLFGKAAGAEYQRGTRVLIKNDRPIIGHYGVNQGGPLDTYYKGGNMLHTIRQVVNNDSTWRAVLRGLNAEFYHQTVTTAQIESYMSAHSGLDLSKIFDQYLRTTMVPVFEYRIDSTATGRALAYRWTSVVNGFAMPVEVMVGGATMRWTPTAEWQNAPLAQVGAVTVVVNRDFYVLAREVKL
jgi:aminopeptidase N